jgi:iron complex outermembrane recepter protein
MTKYSWLLGASFLMGSALMAAPALAQSDDAALEQQQGLQDIIVTAQRRAEPIQSVPVAVTALTPEELDSPVLQDLRDLSGRVPSLVFDPVTAGPSAAAISIRGISFEDIEKSFDPSVGVVLDGVFLGTNTGQLLDSFDIASLEVLRGPQGTLFGRNTIGGVINVTRTRPTGEFGVKASLAYGSYDTITGRFVVNLPSLGDVLALKGYLYYDDTDGFYYNETKKRRAGFYKTVSGGVTGLLTPTDGIEAIVSYDHIRERGETISSPLSGSSPASGDLICFGPFGTPAIECDRSNLKYRGVYSTFANDESPVRADTDSLTGQINVDLGSSFSLVSITGWKRTKERVIQDFDGGSTTFFLTDRRQTYRQFSEELRIVGDIAPWLNVLIGGYYFDSRYSLDQSTRSVLFGPLTQFQNVDHKSESYAAFGDAKIKPTERLTIGLGARYTEDKKAITTNLGTFAGNNAPCPAAVAPATLCGDSDSFGKFTWRASVDYEFGPNRLVYASFSRGFRSGGFVGRAASLSALAAYLPETVDAYEVGLKADWLDRRLRTNIAIYQTDYNDKQEEVVRPVAGGVAGQQETLITNAGKARIRGFEAEVVMVPTDNLTFNASVSHIDAKYLRFLSDVNSDGVLDDISTLTLRRAPDWQWSFGANYTREMGSGKLDIATSFRFVDEYQTTINRARPTILGQVTNDPRGLAETREILDASVAYTFPMGGGEARFMVFGRNLFDDRGLSSTLPVAGLFTFGSARPPRTYGAELQVKF